MIKRLGIGLALVLLCSYAGAKITQEEFVTKSAYVLTVMNQEETYGGTGFLVKGKGLVTAAHVCDTNKKGVLIAYSGGYKITLHITKIDRNLDVCLLDTPASLGFNLASSVVCGEKQVTWGYPNLGPWSQSFGRLCDRVFLQKVIPGQSGSPILNSNLDVTGMIVEREIDYPAGYIVTLQQLKSFLDAK